MIRVLIVEDQAILREMPDSQHAFAFMKTNSMENQ